MRKLLLAASAAALLAGVGAAHAGDINVQPIQDNPTTSLNATVNASSLSTKGLTYFESTAADNVLTANADGSIAISAANSYSPSQLSDFTPTAVTNVSDSTIHGATISATGVSNDMSLTAVGDINYSGAQVDGATVKGTVNVNSVDFAGKKGVVVTAEAAGNVLSPSAGGTLTLANYGGNTFALQNTDGEQIATANVSDVGAMKASFSETAQAVGNDIGIDQSNAVVLGGNQVAGSQFGTGLNSVTGYPGATQIATANLSNSSFGAGVTVGSLAVANDLSVSATNISGGFQQSGTNVSTSAITNVSGASFMGGLNATAAAVGNAINLTTTTPMTLAVAGPK